MSLQGELSELSVVDVLRLVGLARRTGVVRFSRGQGSLTQRGAIYFRDGSPVAAETDSGMGEAALETLCSWDSGEFVYKEGATSPAENLDLPAAALIQKAVSAVEEWLAIRKLLPAPSAPLHLASELPADAPELRLSRQEWGLLARMSRTESMSAWAQQAGGGLPAYRILRGLVEKGLIATKS